MAFRRIEIRYSRAIVLVVAFSLAMFAAVSIAFEPWSLAWFAWCALGLLAAIVLPGEVLRVVADTTTGAPLSAGWFYALCFIWMTFTAAITDAPSLSWLMIGFGGLAITEDVIKLAIGPEPATAEVPVEAEFNEHQTSKVGPLE